MTVLVHQCRVLDIVVDCYWWRHRCDNKHWYIIRHESSVELSRSRSQALVVRRRSAVGATTKGTKDTRTTGGRYCIGTSPRTVIAAGVVYKPAPLQKQSSDLTVDARPRAPRHVYGHIEMETCTSTRTVNTPRGRSNVNELTQQYEQSRTILI